MRPHYTIQRTENAHVAPAESDWLTVAQPWTVLGAYRAMRKLHREARSHGSWSYNIRCLSPEGMELTTLDLMYLAEV
jgi:hypothetical protein